jgi:hypothetical protein
MANQRTTGLAWPASSPGAEESIDLLDEGDSALERHLPQRYDPRGSSLVVARQPGRRLDLCA